MSTALALLRPDLLGFTGYASARRSVVTGSVWLNANESALATPADVDDSYRRYPEPQPAALRQALADLYGVAPDQLMITRGSDEGIDLLVRAFCRAGVDAVLTAPPSFGMYAVCARLQNAEMIEVPLSERDGRWFLDIRKLLNTVENTPVRVVFLCSPANPTGQALNLAEIRQLAEGLRDCAMLVIDEAYVEYSSIPSAVSLREEFPQLVILRTLSKAHALAGARIGALIADPSVIAVLRNLSAPYPIAAPSAELALCALSPQALSAATSNARSAISERQLLLSRLSALPGVRQVYPSEGNYLLVRFVDAQQAFEQLLLAGVVVRDMRGTTRLHDALRISIGSQSDNAQLLAALQAVAA